MNTAGRARGLRVLTGTSGGFFSGLTGVGGGAIMVPLLTSVLGMRQHAAHGTSLVVIMFAAAAGTLVYATNGHIDWALAGMLAPASLAGSYLGARFVQRLPAARLRQVFGLFLLAVALRLLLFRELDSSIDVDGLTRVLVGGAIGLAGGFVAGALGVGGGAIFVPALVLLLGVDQHAAQGASLVVIIPAAAIGALTHARHGSIDVAVAKAIVPSAVPAGVLGSLAAAVIDGAVLQRIFAGVLVVVGIQMVVTAGRVARREAEARRHAAEVLPA